MDRLTSHISEQKELINDNLQLQKPKIRTNIAHIEIVDSTLREGEQFSGSYFTFDQKLEICLSLARFGVDYIELSSPASYPTAVQEARRLAYALDGMKSKLLVQARCNLDDVKLALQCGVYGIQLFIGTSSYLKNASHGKSLEEATQLAVDMVKYIKNQGCQFVGVAAEDSFRTNLDDLLYFCTALNNVNVDQINFPDTVGGATPFEIYERFRELSNHSFNFKFEFHGHNDAGCSVANSYAALEGGASCIDTCVLGIGERNGICSLSGLIARLQSLKPELLTKYNLKELPKLDALVASILVIPIPHDMPITSPFAFAHKAGVHIKAMLAEPRSYEILQPEDFGIERTLNIATRITGKHAVSHRAVQLGVNTLNDDQTTTIAKQIRQMASLNPISLDTVDAIIKSFLHD